MRAFTISVFTVLISISAANGGDYIIIESAAGVGSEVMPFSSEWNGHVSSNGVSFREFAVKTTYVISSGFSASFTGGWLKDHSYGNFWTAMPPPPEYWYRIEATRETIYFIPSIRADLSVIKFDIGVILYDEKIADQWFYLDKCPFKEGKGSFPSLGVELGEERTFFYGRLFDSFPVMSGGGVWELGIGYRTNSFYEHVVYFASSAYQTVGLGYRGELKLYRQTGLSFGVSVGGRDHDNAYNMTLGLINIINH